MRKETSGLVFGTAGIPLSSKSPTTVAGIERVAELGLGTLEIQFVQGVKMSPASAVAVKPVAMQKKVVLSAHAPYFINLNAREPEKVRASQERIMQAARMAHLCGAESVIFHAAFYLGDPPAQVYTTVKRNLEEVLHRLRQEKNSCLLRPEVAGKGSQFGSLEEVLSLSRELEGVAPCLDLAHWHARTGKANSAAEFRAILEQVEEVLGRIALDRIHLHLSGVAYGKGGETKHLLLEESDFHYRDLLSVLREKQVNGVVICESPNLEDDALLLQGEYNRKR